MADVCDINFQGLNKDDIDELKKQANKMRQFANQSGDIEAMEKKLNEYKNIVEAAHKVAKLNSYKNKLKRQKMYDFIDKFEFNGVKRPDLAVASLWTGTQVMSSGSRLSADIVIEGFKTKLFNTLTNGMIKDKVIDSFRTGKFDKEVIEVLNAIDTGLPLDRYNDVSVKIAESLQRLFKVYRSEANRAGAFIGKLDGFAGTRHHDMFKIAKNKQGWIDWMKANVDLDNSLEGIEDFDQHLIGQVKEFSTGAHIGREMSGGGEFTGFSSFSKKLSQSRVYKFKTPAAEYEYMQLWGAGNLFDSISAMIETKAPMVGMMQYFGPAAEKNYSDVVNEIMAKYKNSPDINDAAVMDKIKDAHQRNIRVSIPVVTGRSNVPANNTIASITSVVSTMKRLALLAGSSMASAVQDPISVGVVFQRLNNNRGIAPILKAQGSYYKSLVANLSNPQVQDRILDLQIQTAYKIYGVSQRWSEVRGMNTNSVDRYVAKANEFLFFWNGQYALDSRGRVGVAISLDNQFGSRADYSFNDLPIGFKEAMIKTGIDESDWNFIRKSVGSITDDVPIFKGQKFIDVDGLSYLDDAQIENYLNDKQIKITDFNKKEYVKEVQTKYRAMIHDLTTTGILTPDSKTDTYLGRNIQRGTAARMVTDWLFFLRSFPAAMMQKHIGAEVYSGKSIVATTKNLAAMTAYMTAGGYVLNVIQDAQNGKEPLSPTDPQAWTRAFFTGGGSAFVGDVLSGLTHSAEMGGKNAAEVVLGPILGGTVLGTGLTIGTALSGDAEKASEMVAQGVSKNIPFRNHILAEPILNYLFLNSLQEYLSPNTLVRKEASLLERTGQEYFAMKPSETMLLK